MQSLSVGGYTREEIINELHRSGRTVAFRYELLDANNETAGDIEGVFGASVANNALADIKRTAKFNIEDSAPINYLNSRIRPWFRLKMGVVPSWAEWPLGVFLLATPKRTVGATTNVRQVDAYDQGLVLRDDKVGSRYTVAAGTNVITAVDNALTEAGITLKNLVPTTETLPVALDWPPGTPRAKIIGDLLSSINYRSLYFNAAGYAVAEPYMNPTSRPVGYTYTTQDRSLIVPQAEHELDLFAIPNQWVAVVSEPDRPPLSATYTNTNASSPTSTVSRGRTITDVLSQQQATSLAALQDKVERAAFEASQVYEAINFSTALMPHHEDADLIELEYPGLVQKSRFVEHTWEMDLRAGGLMKHRIRRVVSI